MPRDQVASELYIMVRRMNAWAWAAVAWIGVIFFSSSSLAGKSSEEAFSALSHLFTYLQPGTSSYDVVHLLADKSVHIGLFAVFAVLLWDALGNVSKKAGWILLIGAIIGSCSELLQNFFPGRDPAIRDVFINIGGTALGLVCRAVISKLRRPEREMASVGPPRHGISS
jgi:VanZ family protein